MWHFSYQYPVKLFNYLHGFLTGEEWRATFSMHLSGRAVAVLLIMSLFLYVLPCHLGESGFFSPPMSIRAVNRPSFFMFLFLVSM